MTFGQVVLVLAIAAPLAGLIPALGLVQTTETVRWSRLGALAAAASWAVLLGADQDPRVGALEPQTLGIAVGIGSALLVFNLPEPTVRVGLGLSALTTGFAATSGGRPANGYLAAALVVAFLCALPRFSPSSRLRQEAALRPVVVAAAGVVLCSVGVATEVVPVLAAGAVVTVAATAARPDQPSVILVAGVLGAGLRIVVDTGERVPLALGLGAAATLVVWAAARVLLGRDPVERARQLPGVLTSAVALWVLAAAARPVAEVMPAALLLAAAVVVALPLGGWATAVNALPGGVVLAQAFADAGGATAAALGGLLAATSIGVGRLVIAAEGPTAGRGVPVKEPSWSWLAGVWSVAGWVAARLTPGQAVAAVVSVWLIVAPRTWGWAVPGGQLGAPLGPYQDGTLVAAAVGAVVAVAVLVGRRRQPRPFLPDHSHPERLPG